MRKTVISLLFTLMAGCASPPPSPPPGSRPQPICAGGEIMMKTTLWFRLNPSQGKHVTATEWQHFVEREVTPRFRHGLSVVDASGQATGADGALTAEKSKALVLIYHVEEENGQKIEAVRNAYKQQFAQPSVMRVDQPACVSF